MDDLSIEYRDPKTLRPWAGNARIHTQKQVDQVARSIAAFGFNNPILLDSSDNIIAGHGRALAAVQLGMAHVPTVRLEHLSRAQKRAYVIADNRLAELAGWDSELLAMELQELLGLKLDFNVTDIGFEMPEIDLLMENEREGAAESCLGERDIPETVPSIARAGDLWKLGDHLLFCGDARDTLAYRLLLGSETCDMVFTDPPYNVPIQGHVCGPSNTKHPDFVMASGEMSSDEFTGFLNTSLNHAVAVSSNGALHFICMDWRHIGELLSAGAGIYSELKNLCVWVKSNGGMGSLYRSQHELVGVFKVGSGKHINNVELGRHGRSRTNVWQYAGLNSFQKDRDIALAMHPTVKPIALVRDAIYDCSSRGSIILDPFGGAGTTLIAAHQAGRRARLIELDPHYVDVTLQRFVKTTNIPVYNVWTGRVIEGISEGHRSPSSRLQP